MQRDRLLKKEISGFPPEEGNYDAVTLLSTTPALRATPPLEGNEKPSPHVLFLYMTSSAL
jgi:hypothetical protein